MLFQALCISLMLHSETEDFFKIESAVNILTGCQDSNNKCPTWARNGHCRGGQWQNYMKTNCKRSCGLCNGEEHHFIHYISDILLARWSPLFIFLSPYRHPVRRLSSSPSSAASSEAHNRGSCHHRHHHHITTTTTTNIITISPPSSLSSSLTIIDHHDHNHQHPYHHHYNNDHRYMAIIIIITILKAVDA